MESAPRSELGCLLRGRVRSRSRIMHAAWRAEPPCLGEVGAGARVVDLELVRVRREVLLERRERAERVVERLALGDVLEEVLLVLLREELVLVEHLPDVEVRGAELLPAEELRLVRREP